MSNKIQPDGIGDARDRIVNVDMCMDPDELLEHRIKQVRNSFEMALRSREHVMRHDSSEMRDQAADCAVADGDLKTWLAVFGDDDDMRKRIARAVRLWGLLQMRFTIKE